MIIQPKVARWAVPLITPRRYKGAKGGRSGGKSHQMMELAVAKMAAQPDFKVACIREIQKSIRFSVKSLMEDKIRAMGVAHLFDIQEAVVKRIGGAGVAIFEGMQDHTADSIKGLESFDLALVDEANALSDRSLRLLRPTLRKEGSELHFAWNPENESDPVDVLFRDNAGHPDFVLVHVNITDNPFVSQTALAEYHRDRDLAQRQMKDDPNAWERFRHTWLGEYNARSDRFIFRNWRIGEIEPPPRVVWFYGVDFGFSQDPTAALRCCLIGDRTLYIDHEAMQVGVPMEGLPALLAKVPDVAKWPVTADSARPETIDYLKRNGIPRIRGARKGKGSVEDGITFLQGLDIVVHPRCVNLANELQAYSYVVDKRSGDITADVEDANNHLIDALRYAVERLHRKGKLLPPDHIEDDDRLIPPRDYRAKDYGGESWKVA